MRLVPALTLLAAGSLLVAGHAEARTSHRAQARTLTLIADQPSHGMSPLARQQAEERSRVDFQKGQLLADERTDVRFGGFKRDYSLDVYRPAIRPDQDGAVGLSIRLKTHD